MATLQKIRAKGPLLVIVIGVALFAFIAEEAMRSIQSASNESKQQVGEIYGERISVHEFQNLVDEYAEVVKFTSGNSALNDQQLPNCATKFGTHTSTTNSSSTKLKSWD